MAANPMAFQIDPESAPYGIKLDIFEGPLDLLLFLIRKNEIDIYDIPVAEITRQYLEFVEIMQSLNLEQAGDFVLMAATLMKIKSRMLLPSDGAEDEEAEDPREELVRRLLEYQQFKEVAGWLEAQQEAHRDIFYRGAALDEAGLDGAAAGPTRTLSLFDLLAAFKQALAAAPKVSYHDVTQRETTIEDRARAVLAGLERTGRASFLDLVSGLSRLVLVVTFVAILELVKSGKITVLQADSEGEIWVYRREETAPAPADGPAER